MTEALEFEINSPKPLKISTTGKILLGITGGAALGLTVLCAPFISPALRKFCLPYIPATGAQIENVLKALKGRSGRLLDLGSGDGRIVLETAKNGFRADGIELNLWLVIYSKVDAFRKGLRNKTHFFRGDLWRCQFKPYDNIVIFGVEQMMGELEKKFLKECHKECLIVACRFPLPNRTPLKTIGSGVDSVWVYDVK